MKFTLRSIVLFLIIAFSTGANAQVFPNPATLSTGQGTIGTLDPIWTVSTWYATNPPNPLGLSYSSAQINNNCAPGSWVDPGSLPPPVNNGNWITGQGVNCGNNTNDGYIYFRLTLNLPADCNGNSVAAIGNYILYLQGYADNTITDIFVNGNSTGISGGSFTTPLNITLNGPWLAGINYVDVQVYNFPNGGNNNPYGLLLVANSVASSGTDTDGDGIPDINDQCPCLNGGLTNGCAPVVITGDTVICVGETTILYATGVGTNVWNNGITGDSIIINPLVNTRYSVVSTASNGYVDSAVTHVTVNALPNALVNPSAISICIGASVTLTAMGGNSYVWNDASTNPVVAVSPLTTTPYSVTLTDANGCSATAGSTVTVNLLPVAAINPSAISICNGGNTTLTASGGTSYLWSDASNTAAITVSPITTTPYSVTVTDANTCTATTSATVTVNPLPTPVITPAAVSICPASSTTLTASGGTSYLWSDASITASITVSPLVNTTYSVTVTDANTCTATTSATVSLYSLPVPSINPAAVSICLGTSTTLTASGGVNYLWSNAANTAAITVSPNTLTIYSVTVTDANTCTATTSADVSIYQLPVALINPALITICNGTSTTLTASGGTNYLWSDASNTAAITVSPGTTANYSVTVTDANTCTGSTTSTVTVIPTMILSTVNTNVSCNGGNDGAIDLNLSSGQSPYTYVWNTTAITEDLSGLVIGNYSVTVTDNALCTATAATNITQPTALLLTSSFINPSCASNSPDGSITLNLNGGTTPYQFIWSNGTAVDNLLNIDTGTYSVTVSDANNCTDSSSFALTYIYVYSVDANPGATINLGGSVTLGYSLTGNAGNYVNIWTPSSSLSCNDCVSPVASPATTTHYQIEVRNDAGCVASDTVTVLVVPDYSVFVPNSFTPNGDGNNDLFQIFGNTKILAYLEVKIFNRIGELVFESNDHNFSWDGTYRGVAVTPGVFVWQLKLTFSDGHREEIKQGSLTILR